MRSTNASLSSRDSGREELHHHRIGVEFCERGTIGIDPSTNLEAFCFKFTVH